MNYNLYFSGGTPGFSMLNGSGSTIPNSYSSLLDSINPDNNFKYKFIGGGKSCSIYSQYNNLFSGIDKAELLGTGHVIINGSGSSIYSTTQNMNPSENPKQYIAKTNLLESGQLGITNLKGLAEQRKNIIKQWDESGLLEGLDMSKKSNIAQLLECQASFLLDENEARPMKRIRLRFNHKFKDNNELWKLYIDNETYIVSQVIFMCPVETTLDFDQETNDYKAHVSCDANSIDVDPTSEPGRIIVTVKNI